METKNLTNFVYNNNEIEFTQGGKNGVMVNATQMAKIFDKRLDHFLKTEPTKEFIKLLEFTPLGGNSEPLSKEEIIQTNHRHGTFMHRILALKFASWLNPEFELWVYTTIDQILFDYYRKLEDSLKESAKRKNQMEKLQEELNSDPRFLELEMLKLKERQAAYSRSKMNLSQLELFKNEN
jgi:hypothetical protein